MNPEQLQIVCSFDPHVEFWAQATLPTGEVLTVMQFASRSEAIEALLEKVQA
jgi:hypothetical protein